MARLSGSTQPVGLGKTATGLGGKGLGKSTAKRHRCVIRSRCYLGDPANGYHGKILRDNINGITKGSIRRLARRGGVKRISATIYDEVRAALKDRLKLLLHDICAILECTVRKTITVPDIVFVLNCHGTPIYGFDTPFRTRK
ncbi:hypothetical protein D6D19_08984 [Aureobasidium pullulans]|uniref:Histone H4 n=1 Tax=Aureobasidium pullulans TaxID=5580 RepID=A0A4S8ZQD1_AURPU|nr:hypothetical protein D6D19_08984 [Aureobasidium pullulans]